MSKTLRLDRFLCQATGLSRAQAQLAIRRGQVRLDQGPVVKNPAQHIDPSSGVYYHGEPVHIRGPRYFMLNKPAGVVCATSDTTYRTVIDLLCAERSTDLHPAGRLDRDTTGLVLISDDGEWTHRVTSPRRKCPKTYRVNLAEVLDEAMARQLREGVMLKGEDKPTQPAGVEMVAPSEILLTLHEGRYHQVKRMLAAVGNHVVGLHRERIGEVALDPSLKPGEYRALTPEECAQLARCGA